MAKQTTLDIYQDIKKEWKKLDEITEFGVKKYTDAWIYNKLAKMFYKSPKTIENIVWNRTHIKN